MGIYYVWIIFYLNYSGIKLLRISSSPYTSGMGGLCWYTGLLCVVLIFLIIIIRLILLHLVFWCIIFDLINSFLATNTHGRQLHLTQWYVFSLIMNQTDFCWLLVGNL